jgi:simple sugar transport system ATP-binding protein
MVAPGLTVAENVFFGRQPRRRGGVVDWRRMREQTRKVMTDSGFDVSADTACGNLTVEQRQVIEIIRALAAGIRCLLLDEPTAALERSAAHRLFQRICQLQAQASRSYASPTTSRRSSRSAPTSPCCGTARWC